MSYPTPIKIAIVGGDSVVGHALELMLLSAGYSVRFLDRSRWMNGEADPFGVFSVVLVAPRTSEADRKALLRRLLQPSPSSAPEKKKAAVPMLELVAIANGTQPTENEEQKVYRLLWPCRVKDLKRGIDAALLDSS